MGQQVSVETFSSSRDSHGNKYWASFDPYPFKVGHKKLVYMGILNGDGPLKGQKCVVKTLRKGTLSRKEWMLESQRSHIAVEMAKDYNKMVANRNFKYRLAVTSPITAEIDTLSDCMCINDVLGKPKTNMKETDFVSIELYLRGRFEEFEYGWVDPRELLVPEAFSHFTWCRSEGKFIVSNLQGVKNGNIYHFSSPVIHSEDKDYGISDLGCEGIKGFFRLHKCNRICHSWPRLGDGTDLTGWGESVSYRDHAPTAPPMMMPPPYQEVPRVPSYEEFPSGQQEQYNGQPSNGHQQLNRQMQPSLGLGYTQYNLGNQSTSGQMISRFDNAGPVYQHQYQGRQMTHASSGYGNSHPGTFVPRQMCSGQGMMIDWREMAGMFGNSGFNQTANQSSEMQFMWFVKFMQSYTCNNPPPPYCTDVERQSGNARVGNATSGNQDYEGDDDSDEKYLLPPPYTEQNVDPQYECVTYL